MARSMQYSIFIALLILLTTEKVVAQDESEINRSIKARIAVVGESPEFSLASLYRYLAERQLLSTKTVTLKASDATLSHLLIDEGVIENKYLSDMDRTICLLNEQLNVCEAGRTVPSRIHPGEKFSIPDLNWIPFTFREFVSVRPDESLPNDLEKILSRAQLIDDRTSVQTIEALYETVKKLNRGFETKTLVEMPGSKYFTQAIAVPKTGYFVDFSFPEQTDLLLDVRQFLNNGDYLIISEKEVFTASQSISTFEEVEAATDEWKAIVGLNNSNSEAFGSVNPNILLADKGFNPNHPLLNYEADLNAVNDVKVLSSDCDDDSHGTHLWGILSSNTPGPGISKQFKVETLDIEDSERKLLTRLMDASKPLGIVNISQHLDSDGEMLRCVIAMAHEGLFVIAAGNDGETFSSSNGLPVPVNAYDLPNVIVVGGINNRGNDIYIASNRNTGRIGNGDIPIVHIAAPAEDVYSTCKGPSIGPMSGTSQSAVVVSGAAALLQQAGIRNPNLIKFRLQYTADFMPDYRWQSGFGRLNATRALRHIKYDSICLSENYDPTELTCSKWIKEVLKFGVLEGSEFKEVPSIVIELNNGRQVTLRPDNLLRWGVTRGTGSYGNIAVILKPASFGKNASLSRLVNVYEIKDHKGRPINVKLSDGRVLGMSRFGDFVRSIDHARNRLQTVPCEI